MKIAEKIYTTDNYKLFRHHEINRTVKPRKSLIESMRKHGWFSSHPMHVVKNGKGYVIKEGHNRFLAAQRLALPVKFVILDDDGLMPHEYVPETKWNIKDVMNSFADAGFDEYIKLREFSNRHGMAISQSISLLSGSAGGLDGKKSDSFRLGEFKITSYEFAERVGSVVAYCSRLRKFSSKKTFIGALVRCMRVKGFDPERFMQKFKAHHGVVEEKPTIQGFVNEIEKVYNRAARDGHVLPIAVYVRG